MPAERPTLSQTDSTFNNDEQYGSAADRFEDLRIRLDREKLRNLALTQRKIKAAAATIDSSLPWAEDFDYEISSSVMGSTQVFSVELKHQQLQAAQRYLQMEVVKLLDNESYPTTTVMLDEMGSRLIIGFYLEG